MTRYCDHHHVGPQNGEAEEQLSDVVQLLGTDVVLQSKTVPSPDRDDGHERDPHEQVADEVVRTHQCRKPMGVECHDEVERHEREYPGVGDQQCWRQPVLGPLAAQTLLHGALPIGDQPAGESGGQPLTALVEHPNVGSQRAIEVRDTQSTEQQERQDLANDEETGY